MLSIGKRVEKYDFIDVRLKILKKKCISISNQYYVTQTTMIKIILSASFHCLQQFNVYIILLFILLQFSKKQSKNHRSLEFGWQTHAKHLNN